MTSKYVGGLLTRQIELVSTSDTGRHAFSPSQATLDALNRVQSAAWRINVPVLRIMQQVLDNGDQLGEFPSADPVEIVPLSPETYRQLDTTQRRALRVERTTIHKANEQRAARAERIRRTISAAAELAGEEAVYFPHRLDFRGRVYSVPQDVSPQGDDVSKGLLMFAEPQSLKADGWYWLSVSVSNAFGNDKVSFEERVAWAQQHRELILDSVRDPLDGERFWSSAAEPWVFLALAHDYAREVTQHPVRLDATCSGLQNLFALSLDEQCGAEVNLVPGPRRDIYTVVANAAAQKVSEMALQGDPMATAWANKVTRAVVKRAVMSIPYGVTTSGIREGLIEPAQAVASSQAYAAAKFMAFRIAEAVTGRMGRPELVMEYLRGVARVMDGRPISWTAPSGSVVTQAYAKPAYERVETLLGKLSFIVPGESKDMPDPVKSVNSLPANYVHSMDAALLVGIVNSFERGPLTVIHDSVGTYANWVGELGQVSRDAFADQYAVDWLKRFHAEQRERQPELAEELPAPPPRGALDIEQCRIASYLFS